MILPDVRASFRGAARVFAAALSLGLASPLCAADAPMGDGSVVRVLSNPAGTQSFPPYVIKRFGLDRKYGFELQIVPAGDTGSMITGFQAGAGELAVLDWVNVARLRQAGVPVIGIAPFLTYVNTIIVPADSPASTVADLSGKTIGALSVSSFDWIMTLTAARAAGVDLSAGSQIVEGAPTLMRGMLEQGRLDATLMYNSLTPATVVGGKFRVMTTIRALANDMGLPDVPFIMYAANQDWAGAHPDTARAFVAAYRDAVEILKTDQSVWTDHAVGDMGMAPEAADMFRDEVRADLLTRFSDGDNATYTKTFGLLFETAGEKAFGFSRMPEAVVTQEYE